MQLSDQSDQQPYAILIGLDSMTGLQAARILARNHVPVIAIANSLDHYNCRTRVCKQILQADTTGDELLVVLEKIGRQLNRKMQNVKCQM